MKVVILAGGLGCRLSDDNELRLKPMAEIGNRPLPWHQMHYFARFGFDHFVCIKIYSAGNAAEPNTNGRNDFTQ